MLPREENELLTRIGPGTAAGELMRRYWQPAALSEELPDGGAPIPVRLFGDDLVLFRDEEGLPGLLGIHCAHRGADLSYGRIEDGGLRCIYHGWLYDRTGRCLEQPGEPVGSTFHERIRHTAYPCQEKGGIIFAYMGPGDPPLFPGYEFLSVPDENRVVTKIFQDCNYLQGNEGNQDPIHLSFLHQMRRDQVSDLAIRTDLMARDTVPKIDLEIADWGLRIYAVRNADQDTKYVRLTNTVMPNLTCFGGYRDGYSVNWHVAIDDTHHWKYTIMFRRGGPMDKQQTMQARADTTQDYHLVRNKANRYLQDREEMKATTFLGMGSAFQVHDTWATEGAGPIQDRTQEHLTPGDIAIVTARKLLLAAIKDVQDGRDPRNVVRDEDANRYADLVLMSRVIPIETDHRTFWKEEPREMTAATRS
jgi:phenylpropionate dioxygenase-like ring-hydroxylating dioxygenase large terminal subunit